MKYPGVCCCALMLLMFLLGPVSKGFAAEHEFEAEAVYRMSADESKIQAEETVRKLALRHAAEEAAAYIIEHSEADIGFTTADEIEALAAQVLKLKDDVYDWQFDSQTGVLEVTAKIVAVLDEETVDAKLLEMVQEYQLSERQTGAAKASVAEAAAPAFDSEEIDLLKEMDRQHHYTAEQWYRQARSMFYMEAYKAAIYACERTMELESDHIGASNLWMQAHKKLGKMAPAARNSAQEK